METAPQPRAEELFLEFFYLLREAGLPVSSREWLTFVEALAKGLVAADLHRFYALARCTLVKDEKHYDLFDQVFVHHFAGLEPPAGLKSALDEWLQNPLPLPQLSPEEFAALEQHSL